ncbi:MAG: right-handed parallel beta-helix repeat-containing protein [Verrucomicrobia bacterium]|nr:right-handed parallel beta-helix repeat-containing protein [Verrucomicrobiota bacterium]
MNAYLLVAAALLLAPPTALHAADLHVATTGDDAHPGTALAPLRTIQRAADLAQPGDVITVHAGVYRERVNPPRGGESAAKRIIYQAAPGDQVEIKGSEVVKGWVKMQDEVWKVTVPNTLFGGFNPYRDLIHGDWFWDRGRPHHTGAVYLNGKWVIEAAKLEEVLKPIGQTPLWFAQVDQDGTTLWAQFKGVNPNEQLVEINVRRTVFYPDQPGRNFITVRGFTMRHAATPWAPPTAEQVALIGTHWSMGWIIEDNVISHSACSGVSLGKYGDEFDNKSSNSAEGYVGTINRALKNGWNKDAIGHHLVRNNTISHCGQAGIVGSLGAAFSKVIGNTIHDIHVERTYDGCEQAGVKFHGAIDSEIRGNHVYRAYRGLWLDWMSQGTRVTGNLFHDNSEEDLYVEVNHGPFLVDNNLLLSSRSVWDMSEGGAFVHNLMTGKIDNWYDMGRLTPHLQPHSTAVAGLTITQGGDNRYFNNIFVGQGLPGDAPVSTTDPKKSISGFGLRVYDVRNFVLQTGGNVYYNGARPYAKEVAALALAEVDPKFKITEQEGGVHLQFTLGQAMQKAATTLVTTDILGKARVPDLPYENPDGSPVRIDTDYFGRKRNPATPTAGPFENPGSGPLSLKVR